MPYHTVLRLRNWVLLLSLTGLVLPACHSRHEVERTETMVPVAAPATTVLTTQTLAQRFGPIIGGGWLSSDYLRELRKVRSPSSAAAHISANIPVSMFIEPTVGAADSTKVELNFNMHEGDEASIFFRAGHAENALPLRSRTAGETTSYCEVSFRISASDTTLYLAKYSTRGKLIWRTAYTKTLKSNAKRVGNEWPRHQAVNYPFNKILVVGNYSGTDSLGHQVTAYFAPNGQVTGLPFHKYHILEDFIGPSSGDEIIFDINTKKQKGLTADFRPDTLRLYTILSAVKMSKDTTITDSILVFRIGSLHQTRS